MTYISRLSGAITPFLSGPMDRSISGTPLVNAFSPSHFTPPTLCSAHSGSESSGGRLWKAAGVVAILGAAGYLLHKVTDRGAEETNPAGTALHPSSSSSQSVANLNLDAGFLSKAEEAQYTAIQVFCHKNGIDFSEVHQLASTMLEASSQMNRWASKRYPSSERLKALFLASILMSLPKNPFYERKTVGGEERNKEFVDTILAYAKRGKLKIAVSISDSEAHMDDWTTGQYDGQHQSIYLKRLPDPSDLLARMTIVHELYHFYQDIQGRKLSGLETESQAFIQASAYALLDQGLDSEEKVKEFFHEHSVFSEKNQIFQAAGIWVAYHQSKRGGDEQALQDWTKKLEDLIDKKYGARQLLTAVLKRSQNLFAQIRKKESPELIQGKIANLDRALEREKGKLLTYLETSPDACRDDKELWKQKATIYNILINRILYKLAEEFPNAEDVDIAMRDPAIQETVQKLTPLRLTVSIFCNNNTGVK